LSGLSPTLHDFAASADGVRDRAKREIVTNATARVYADIGRPRLGVVDVDLELTAVAGVRIDLLRVKPNG
jgi:hypothetical protein